MSSYEKRLAYYIANEAIVSSSLAVMSPVGGVYMGLRSGGTNPITATKWGLPGGKMDFGETIVQAGMRKTYEKFGIETKVVSDPVMYDARVITDGKHAGKALLGFVALAEPYSPDGSPVIPTPIEDTVDIKVMSLDEICQLGSACCTSALHALSSLGMQLTAPDAQEILSPPTPPLGRDLRGIGILDLA